MKMEYIVLVLLIALQVEIIAFIAYMYNRSEKAQRPTFVDTSVLMDGRITTIVRSGFVPDRLYIPTSVLQELQLVADGSDSDKRARARHGLDIAAELTQSSTKARIVRDRAPNGVDESLLALAKKYKGSICTIDFNLNKVATAQNIAVLNVHELARQLRLNYLPGEKVSLEISQKGSETHQGVGYLADGTMVVVDNAKNDIHSVVTIEVVRSIQTAAGRMLFGKKIDTKTKHEDRKASVHKTGTKPRQSFRQKKTSAEDSLISLVKNQ